MENESASKSEQIVLSYLAHQEGYVSVKDLSDQLKVSRRTIYYLFDRVNRYLMGLNLEPIQNVRGKGYYLKENTKDALKGFDKNQRSVGIRFTTREERLYFDTFLICISDVKVTIDRLTKINDVSRNTTISDLKHANLLLEKYQIEIRSDKFNGHYICGKEEQIRSWLHEAISEKHITNEMLLCEQVLKLFKGQEIIELERSVDYWLENMEQRTGKYFSDDTFQIMKLFITLVLKRMFCGHKVTNQIKFDTTSLKRLPEYAVIHDFFKTFSRNTELSENEVIYLETVILGGQLNHISATSNVAPQKFTDLNDVTIEVINNFRRISGVTFYNLKELRHNLYVHLLAVFYRVSYGMQFENHLLQEIKDKYQKVFQFTKYSIEPFEKFVGHRISDDEIAFISIYFGGEIEKHAEASTSPKQKVLIVCSNGLGTSKILQQQLQAMFPFITFEDPITERDYLKRERIDEQIVISTIKIPREDKNVIVVNPIPTDADKKRLVEALLPYDYYKGHYISGMVNGIIDVVSDYARVQDFDGLTKSLTQYLNNPLFTHQTNNRQPTLSELLRKNNITLMDAVPDWQTAIVSASRPLLRGGVIQQRYIDKMISEVEKNGPYIVVASQVALAHARPEAGVLKLGMSLLKLNKGVDFGGEHHDVKIIFTLAPENNNSHLHGLSELSELLSDDRDTALLINATSYQNIEKLLKKYSQSSK